jgi:hypothetical protein
MVIATAFAGILGVLAAIVWRYEIGLVLGLALVAFAPLPYLHVRSADSVRNPLLWLMVGVIIPMGVFALFHPISGSDAWAIWSVKAKALSANGDFSHPIFHSSAYVYSHQDYPPLFPVLQAPMFRLAGAASATWPITVFITALWAASGIAATRIVTSRWGTRSTVPVLALFLAPALLRQLPTGLADVPMTLFLSVGTLILLTGGNAPRDLVWPGLLLGAAAMTKNEGFAFAVFVAIVIGIARHRRRFLMLSAAFAPASIWLGFVRLHGIGNDVVNANTVYGGLDLGRLAVIGRYLAQECVRGWWPALIAMLLLVRNARLRCPPVAVAAVSWVTIVSVYLMTPVDVTWHLTTSASRTILGPMALSLIAIASAVSCDPPGEALEGRPTDDQ